VISNRARLTPVNIAEAPPAINVPFWNERFFAPPGAGSAHPGESSLRRLLPAASRERNIELATTNMDKLAVEVEQVFENNLVYFLTGGYMRA